jgi:hypothetical protein
MISRLWSWNQAARTSAVVAASVLAIGVAACGSSTVGSNKTSATKTVTASQSAPAAGPSAPAPSQTAPAADGNGASVAKSDAAAALPDYQPASLVSRSQYSTVLTSPDSVSKIGSYYQDVLAKGGWQLRSSSITQHSASFTAHRASEGVSISVYPRGSGSGVSISTHPE